VIEPCPVRGDRGLELALAIHNRVLPRRALTVEDVRSWERRTPRRTSVLAELEGEPVGGGHGEHAPGSEHPHALAYVLPERRGRGVGSAIYAALSAWLRDLPSARVVTSVEAEDADSLAWALRRGFAERTRDSLMVLDLERAGPPRVSPPEGVEIVTWAERPELAAGIYEVFREALPDVPGEEGEPLPSYDEWLTLHMTGSGDRAEATFVAVAGDEVAGYAKLAFTDARPGTAFHDLTGVRRAWRGRGLARALKATQIGWARRAGYRRLETMNEARNEPIRRLNAEFGYREEPGRVTLVGPLSAG
jgi:mycothiol synthase